MKGPSSKINTLLIIVVIITVGTISIDSVVKRTKSRNAQPNPEPQIITDLEIKRNGIDKNETDNDNDGLANWEEALRGTDPNNADSDDDGTNDGDEIIANRDPLVPGPDDKQNEIANTASENAVTYDNYKPNSVTDKVSQNLISNYLNFKQNDQYTPEIGANLVSSITSDLQKIDTRSDIYTALSAQSRSLSAAETKIYGNAFATMQLSFIEGLAEIDNNDATTYLSIVASGYKGFAKNLMGLQVPQAITQQHVAIANNLHNVGVAIDDINTYESDPTVAILAAKKWQEIEQEQPQFYAQISDYFLKNGILFNTNESGYTIWNK